MTQNNLQDERLSKKNSVGLDSMTSAGTFELQDKLPLLPIPELKQTCEKFLAWVKPLLNDGEFQKTSLIVKKFMQVDGEGAKLQQSLIEWSQVKGMKSWLEGLWEETYLSFRKSLPINSNVFYICDDNPNHENLTQTQKAAALIISVLQFKELIDSGTLEVDNERGKPLCMVQYQRLFNSTRIPLKEKDVSRNPFSKNRPTFSDAGYIMVHCQGRLFSLNVYEYGRKMRRAQEIESDLAAIRELANEEPEIYSCGILTTLPRDEWAETREYMMTTDAQNELLLDTIEGAIFSICLEDSQPETLIETSHLMMHGDGKDRWFDKSLQLIVCRNGTTALNVEHSRLDGSVIGRLQKHILGDNGAYKWQEEKNLKPRFQELRFKLNGKLREDITRAIHVFDELIKDTHVRVWSS